MKHRYTICHSIWGFFNPRFRSSWTCFHSFLAPVHTWKVVSEFQSQLRLKTLVRKLQILVILMRYVVVVLLFYGLRHILGHLGRGQLTYTYCSWPSFLSSSPVLSAHSFACNWQLPFLDQRNGENVEIISWPNSTKECYRAWESNPRPSAYRADADPTELPRPAFKWEVESLEISRYFDLWFVNTVYILLVGVLLLFPCFLLFVLSLGMLWYINGTFPDLLY